MYTYALNIKLKVLKGFHYVHTRRRGLTGLSSQRTTFTGSNTNTNVNSTVTRDNEIYSSRVCISGFLRFLRLWSLSVKIIYPFDSESRHRKLRMKLCELASKCYLKSKTSCKIVACYILFSYFDLGTNGDKKVSVKYIV